MTDNSSENIERKAAEIKDFFDCLGLERAFEDTASDLISRIEVLSKRLSHRSNRQIVDNISHRIKSPESIVRKLVRKNRVPTPQNAIATLHDMIGIRVVCPFQDDVFRMSEEIQKNVGYDVVNCKDFVSNPKDSGYRSIHIILACNNTPVGKVFAEVQVRSVAMNYWAILDHLLYYKKDDDRIKSLQKEIKACAADIAAIDRKFYKIRRRIEKLT